MKKYDSGELVSFYNHYVQGYALKNVGVLRDITGDSGMAEEIVFGTLKSHDMELCIEMLKNSPCFHENDVLINDKSP